MSSVIAGKVITLLEADNNQFKQKIGESQKTLGGLLSSFRTLKVAGVASFAAIGASALSAIKAYNIQEKAVAKLNAVLKATKGAAQISSQEMQKNASALQKITTYGDEAIISMQAILATFTNIKGDVFKDATKSILDMSAVLDGNLKGGAVQLGRALNDPLRGISALSQVGVSFTNVQRDMIRNFVNQNDLASAQRVILNELKNEFGGTAEAMAGTFGGQIDQMKNAWRNLKEQIGKTIAISLGFKEGVGGEGNLVTKLTGLVEALGKFVDRIHKGNLTQGEKIGVGVGTAGVGVAGIVGLTTLGSLISTRLITPLINYVKNNISKLQLVNRGVFSLAMAYPILDKIALAIKAIGAAGLGLGLGATAIAAGVVLLNKEANDKESYWQTFKVALRGTLDMIKNVSNALLGLVGLELPSEKINAITDALKKLSSAIIDSLGPALSGLKNVLGLSGSPTGKEGAIARSGDWLLNLLTGGMVEGLTAEMNEGTVGRGPKQIAKMIEQREKKGIDERSKIFQEKYHDRNDMFTIDFSSGAKHIIDGIFTDLNEWANPTDFIQLPMTRVPDEFFERIEEELKIAKEIESIREKNRHLVKESEELEAHYIDALLSQKERIREENNRNIDTLSGAFAKGGVEASRIINQLSTNTPENQIKQNTKEANRILNEIRLNTQAIKDLEVALP